MRSSRAFSLVELMIVVAIIGILAAIAIPNFTKMQLKSKRAELPGNVDAIKTAEFAYAAAYDTYLNAVDAPDTTPDKSPRPWVTNTAFTKLSWEPDGEVRGSYAVAGVTDFDFNVHGYCDVDGEGTQAHYRATSSTNTTLDAGHEDIY